MTKTTQPPRNTMNIVKPIAAVVITAGLTVAVAAGTASAHANTVSCIDQATSTWRIVQDFNLAETFTSPQGPSGSIAAGNGSYTDVVYVGTSLTIDGHWSDGFNGSTTGTGNCVPEKTTTTEASTTSTSPSTSTSSTQPTTSSSTTTIPHESTTTASDSSTTSTTSTTQPTQFSTTTAPTGSPTTLPTSSSVPPSTSTPCGTPTSPLTPPNTAPVTPPCGTPTSPPPSVSPQPSTLPATGQDDVGIVSLAFFLIVMGAAVIVAGGRRS